MGGSTMRIMLLILFALLPLPADAAWMRGESDHFILYSNGGEKALRAASLRLEQFDTVLRATGRLPKAEDQVKLTVYFLSDIDAVQRVYGAGGRDIAGFYAPVASGPFAVTPRITGSDDFGDIVLFHEYAHHVMQQYFPVAYPAWYVEGFAEFLSTAKVLSDGKTQLGGPATHRVYDLLATSGVRIESLLTASIGELSRETTGNFYGRAWLLVHLLSFDDARRGQLSAYLNRIANGEDSLTVARSVFGDLATLNKDMDRVMKASRITVQNLPIPLPANPSIAITPLSGADGELVPFRIILARGTEGKEGGAMITGLRKFSLKHPESALAYTLLAEAELDAGHFDFAIAAADSAIKIDPKNARAMVWRARAMMEPLIAASSEDAAAWKAVRGWIVRANRANPLDPLALFDYYRSFGHEGKPAPELAIDGLSLASALVPQAGEFRVPFAIELARKRRYKDAATVLGPIANDPHGSSGSDYARKLMARFRAAAAAAKPPEFEEIMSSIEPSGSTDK